MNIIHSISIFILISLSTISTDQFEEEIFVNQLPNGFVYTLFQFTTTSSVNVFEETLPAHYNLLPRSFGEIISKFEIAELHLSLTQGRWRYNKWGYPVVSAPTGIELWVWFHPTLNASSVDNNWFSLVHALSGQFCSSINFVGRSETTAPLFSFKPLGVWPSDDISPAKHLRYAALPKESVCTENLTPWKKLLPCGDVAGIASLLNALKIYDSSYHSLAIHLRSVCETADCDQPSLELSQTLSSVFDPVHSMLYGGWSLHDLFNVNIEKTCPVASSSKIFVNTQNLKVDSFKPKENSLRELLIGGSAYNVAVFDVHEKGTKFPFKLHVDFDLPTKGHQEPFLLTHKHTTGFGEEYGGSSCIIKNIHPTKEISIVYLDVMSYFVRAYLHTLQITINDEIVLPANLSFTPAYHRDRPARLEFRLTLPPHSTTVVYIEFEKVFLDWTQHPPDAHHGYYMSSSVISGMVPMQQFSVVSLNQFTGIDRMTNHSIVPNGVFRRVYTEPLLLRIPVPDFSMPYNVICLTCTVIAIAFGSIYNLTTRTFQVESNSKPNTFKQKIASYFQMFKWKTEPVEKTKKMDATSSLEHDNTS